MQGLLLFLDDIPFHLSEMTLQCHLYFASQRFRVCHWLLFSLQSGCCVRFRVNFWHTIFGIQSTTLAGGFLSSNSSHGAGATSVGQNFRSATRSSGEDAGRISFCKGYQ